MSREDEIRLLAYSLWEQEGRQEGRDNEYWLRAEAIWEQQNPSATAKKTSTGPKTAVKQKAKITSTSKR